MRGGARLSQSEPRRAPWGRTRGRELGVRRGAEPRLVLPAAHTWMDSQRLHTCTLVHFRVCVSFIKVYVEWWNWAFLPLIKACYLALNLGSKIGFCAYSGGMSKLNFSFFNLMRENFTDGKTHILKRWRLFRLAFQTGGNLHLYFLEPGRPQAQRPCPVLLSPETLDHS